MKLFYLNTGFGIPLDYEDAQPVYADAACIAGIEADPRELFC